MIAQVDQSIKIENTSQDTVLALANDISSSVLVPASVKRICLQELRERGIQGNPAVLRVFAAALFLLIEDKLPALEHFAIDKEYPGHDSQVKSMLVNWIRRSRPRFDPAHIIFVRVGKQSPAHKHAIRIVRGKTLPERVLTVREIMALL
jgi:hypothetical protein